jgi:hypothetical protein
MLNNKLICLIGAGASPRINSDLELIREDSNGRVVKAPERSRCEIQTKP